MKTENIYYSPKICYEITKDNNSYNINVYLQGHKESEDTHLHSCIENFTPYIEVAEKFALLLSQNAALPVHVPELAEEFLSTQ